MTSPTAPQDRPAARPDGSEGPAAVRFPTAFPAVAAMEQEFRGLGGGEGFGRGWDGLAEPGIDLDRLLEALDGPRPERADAKPAWLRDLVGCVSDLFEPLSRTGRVGYECRPREGRWELGVFLSAAEHVGGALDGHVETVNFRFDVAALFKCFSRVDGCVWGVFPTPAAIDVDGLTRRDIPNGLSTVVIEGLVQGEGRDTQPASVTVYSVPPKASGIGLKLYAGGEARPS